MRGIRAGGNITSKYCGFRSGRFSLQRSLASPLGRFPVYDHSPRLPFGRPDYHLAHTAIPVMSSLPPDSLGVFLNNAYPSSSLFCSETFMQQRAVSSGLKKHACYLQSLSHHSRQATLHPAHSTLVFAPRRRFTPRPCPRSTSTSHRSGSPRSKGQRLYAITDRPRLLTPSTSPQLGVGGRHQRLHRCALDGFLGPPSKMEVLTRILHHLP